MLEIYHNIRERRKNLGMTQQELALKVGYTDRSTIAKIEAGKIDIPQSTIVALAKALECEPGDLMGSVTSESPNFSHDCVINTDEMADIIELVRKLPDDDIKRVLEYTEFLMSKVKKDED